MKTQKEHIKLNTPCWICNKEIFLGEGIVSYPIKEIQCSALQCFAHLNCVLKKEKEKTINNFVKEMEVRLANLTLENQMEIIDKTAKEIIK
jgi:hypothetical protein